MCYWTTPFGDSVLAIQSARKIDFPSNPPYSPELQALINYMLLPEQNLRPDIHQLSELVHKELMEVPNPVAASKTSSRPWTFQEITDYFKSAGAEQSGSSQANSESKKAPVAATVLETSVTPRQRPKASNLVQPQPQNVLATPQLQQEGTTPGSIVIMPPPKSPKMERKTLGEPVPFSSSGTGDSQQG